MGFIIGWKARKSEFLPSRIAAVIRITGRSAPNLSIAHNYALGFRLRPDKWVIHPTMKTQTLAFLVLLSLGAVRADDLIQNGDFSSGIDHWHGNGQAPADFKPDDPFAASDPFTSKGMIIKLKERQWTKVIQDFKGKSSTGALTITYMVSPDLAFSEKPDDYVNVPGHIDYNAWRPFDIPVGLWIAFLSDFGSAHGTYYKLKPKLGSNEPQTLKMDIKAMTPYEDKTITFAFPPGKGLIVILNVSLTSE